jgi:hypothetical protein
MAEWRSPTGRDSGNCVGDPPRVSGVNTERPMTVTHGTNIDVDCSPRRTRATPRSVDGAPNPEGWDSGPARGRVHTLRAWRGGKNGRSA